MIWFPLLVLGIVLASALVFARSDEKTWRGSPRTGLDDQPYLWEFKRGSKGRPLSSKLGIPADLPFTFRIEEERWHHLLFKWLGLCVECQTEDGDFDRRMFIVSDDPSFHRKLRHNRALHHVITELFKHGVCELTATEKHLIATMRKVTPDLPIEDATAISTLLYHIRQQMEHGSRRPRFFEKAQPQLRHVFGSLHWSFGFIAIAAFLLAETFGYQLADWDRFRDTYIPVTLVLLGGIFFLIWLLFRHSSHGHAIVRNYIFFGLITGALATGSVLWLANCLYDGSQANIRQSLVHGKHITKPKRSRSYHLKIDDWRRPGDTLSVQVPYPVYEDAQVGRYVLAHTRPGAFGIEWIEKVETGGLR